MLRKIPILNDVTFVIQHEMMFVLFPIYGMDVGEIHY